MLGSPILYLKGMRRLMFQLSGFYCKGRCWASTRVLSGFGLRVLGFRVEGFAFRMPQPPVAY